MEPKEEEDFDILNGSDEFPYPVSIIGTDFKNFNQDEIDTFLFTKHRFNSLDSLIKDLTTLHTNLNENLLNLVNEDYADFIKLGKSITLDREEDLITCILEDLKDFKFEMMGYLNRFDGLDIKIKVFLENRERLVSLKTFAKLNLILHDQLIEFDHLINVEDEDELTNVVFKKLTSLYISIINISSFLNDNDDYGCLFNNNYVKNKIGSISLEFKSFLDQLIKKELKKSKTNRNSNLIFELLNVYKLIGKETDLLSLLKK
ncbi:hypothetical protein SBY92_004085 [Candida maltosa Xu316]|uniref:Conserved oligomeric Golgi complex subunit 2 n=1 Tax=Candida maltosa (strain Xu316) TaxID=1245528 RepID=M3K251_CANMX|nr:hypothetical protein G210_0577 [Candida maltosa Xu316]